MELFYSKNIFAQVNYAPKCYLEGKIKVIKATSKIETQETLEKKRKEAYHKR